MIYDEPCGVKFVECCILWAHLRVSTCMCGFDQQKPWLYREVTRQTSGLFRLKCELALIALVVMNSALEPD